MRHNSAMTNKPNKWIAALLGPFGPALGLFYVAKPAWAFFYLGLQYLAIAGVLMMAGPDSWQIASVLSFVVIIASAVHAFFFARRYPDGLPRPWYSRWYGLLSLLVAYLLLVFGVRSFVVEFFRMPAGSMAPTLNVGSLILVSKWGYGNYGSYGINLFHAPIAATVRRGDILVFEFPPNREKDFVKRLIGLPGDTVSYANKQLSINGVAVGLQPAGTYVDARDGESRFFRIVAETLGDVHYSTLVDNDQPAVRASAVRDFPMKENCQYDNTGFTCKVPAGHYFMMGDSRDNSDDSRYWGFVPADAIKGRVVTSFSPRS